MHRTDLHSPIFGSVTWEACLFLVIWIVTAVVVGRSFFWAFPLCLGSLLGLKLPSSEGMDSPPDARCGAMCALCTSYTGRHCSSCAFGDETVRMSCPINQCAEKKQTLCTECPEMLHCRIYRDYANKCPFEDAAVLKDTLPCGGFLVKESRPNRSLELFTDRIIRGDLGLIIMRQPPDVLPECPPLEKVPVVQLNQTANHSSCLDPTNMAKLHLTIEEFFKAAPRATILLEGMEYLIVHNNVDRILKFVHSVAQCAKTYSSRFITLIDPRVLEEEELVALERILTLVPQG